MKKRITFLAFWILISLQAQVAVNTNGNDADPSAILDVQSEEKGILIPRMTAAQRDAITSPANGLLVLVTDDKSIWMYDGTQWVIASADNLGNHKANQNLQMQGYWISNDGDDEGIKINPDGSIEMTNTVDGSVPSLKITSFDPDIELNINSSGTASMVEYRFSVDDTLRANMYLHKSNLNLMIHQRTDVGNFYIKMYRDTVMTVTQDNFVGINQTAPAYPLDVNGKVRHGKELYFYSDSSNHGATRWAVFAEGSQYGDAMYLGSGGTTVIGGGESATRIRNNFPAAKDEEYLILASDRENDDEAIKFITSLQDDWNSRVEALTIAGNGNVGINTSPSDAKLHVLMTSPEEKNFRIERISDYAPRAAGVLSRRARGTVNSPAAVQSDDALASLVSQAYDGNEYLTSAWMRMEVDGNVSDNVIPTRILFNTMDSLGNWNPETPRVVITNTGNIGVGTAHPESKFHIVFGEGQSEKNLRLERVNNNNKKAAGILALRARGTFDQKEAVRENDGLMSWAVKSYDGNRYVTNAWIRVEVDGAVEADKVPARIEFNTMDADGNWNANSPRVVIKNDGKVGIGITEPQRTLHIKDVMRLEPQTSAPANAAEGDLYYDANEHTLKIYTDEGWKKVSLE